MIRRALLALALALPAAAADAPFGPPAARGPLLPRSRIVTFYGNPLSSRMGILGELPPEQLLARLEAVAGEWQRADPAVPVTPGLELVATVASEHPGSDGRYRARMPDALINKVIAWARTRGWITILDVQVGRSKVLPEIERLRPFLRRPDVHLALDPEFQMRRGLRPGQLVGSSDAEDVNIAIDWLQELVRKERLPPKLLLVHRFTDDMLKRYRKIRLAPDVQVVVVMDGFGKPSDKRRIYRREVAREPVQYPGIKLFFKKDQPLMKPEDLLPLQPTPLVVIYQ